MYSKVLPVDNHSLWHRQGQERMLQIQLLTKARDLQDSLKKIDIDYGTIDPGCPW